MYNWYNIQFRCTLWQGHRTGQDGQYLFYLWHNVAIYSNPDKAVTNSYYNVLKPIIQLRKTQNIKLTRFY